MSENWLLGLHKHHDRAGANEGCPRTDLGEKPGSVFPQRQLLQETLHSTRPRRLSLFGNHFLMEINLKIRYGLKTTYMDNWEQNEGVKVSPQGAKLYSVVYHICLVWFLLSHLQLNTHLISHDILNPFFFSITLLLLSIKMPLAESYSTNSTKNNISCRMHFRGSHKCKWCSVDNCQKTLQCWPPGKPDMVVTTVTVGGRGYKLATIENLEFPWGQRKN